MLGLPDGVTACLFDLDGVLTQTAKVHAAAWKQMFDEYLRERAEQTRRGVRSSTRSTTTTSTSTASRATTACARSSQSRGIELPEGTPDDPPDAETICGLGNRKNELVLKLIKERRRRAVRGLGALRQGGPRRRPAPRGRLLERQLPATCSVAAGIEDLFEARDRRHRRRRSEHLQGQAGARHVPGRRPRARGRARRRRPCSRTRWPGSQAGRAGSSASSSASTASARRDALRAARRRRRGQGPGRAARRRRDRAPGVPGRAVGGPRDRAPPRHAGPDRVGVRARQRAHRAARQPRRGRAVRPARHLPRRLLRDPAAAVRRGRLRLPRGRPDGRQRHQRQAHPAAGRRRAVRRPLRRAACTTSGCSTSARACCAASVEWASPDRTRRARALDAAGVVHPARGGGDRVRGRGARRRVPASSCSPSWWPTRQLPAASARPARRGGAGRAAGVRRCTPRGDLRAILVHHTTHERAAGGGGDGPLVRGPGRDRRPTAEAFADLARVDGHRRPGARQAAADRQVLAYGWSARAVGAGAARPGAAAAPRRRHTGWDGLLAEQRELPRRLLGARRRRARRRRRAPAGGPLRPVPHPPGGRPRRAAGDRRQGADRPRLRRPHVLGHRDVRAAGAHLHRPARRRRRPALAPLRRSTWPASGRSSSGCKGAAFPWRTIRGEECSSYWPAGTAAFHINADIADAVVRYQAATGDARLRARRRRRAAGRDGAAVALARPPRRRRAASASTASPAPTSTARSPTTTSTPT